MMVAMKTVPVTSVYLRPVNINIATWYDIN